MTLLLAYARRVAKERLTTRDGRGPPTWSIRLIHWLVRDSMAALLASMSKSGVLVLASVCRSSDGGPSHCLSFLGIHRRTCFSLIWRTDGWERHRLEMVGARFPRTVIQAMISLCFKAKLEAIQWCMYAEGAADPYSIAASKAAWANTGSLLLASASVSAWRPWRLSALFKPDHHHACDSLPTFPDLHIMSAQEYYNQGPPQGGECANSCTSLRSGSWQRIDADCGLLPAGPPPQGGYYPPQASTLKGPSGRLGNADRK